MISQTMLSTILGTFGAVIGATAASQVNAPDPAVGLLWQLVGCAGGAMTSVWVQPWRKMTGPERIIAFVIAFAFAFFVTPVFFPIDGSRESGGRFYLMATASFVLIPLMIRKARENFGTRSEIDE